MADDDDHHEQSMVTNGVGEVVPLRGFWQPHKPVYVPGFGPEDPPQVSMTRQEFADEADINKIMAKYDGAWPPPPNDFDVTSLYLDVSNVPNLMEAHEYMAQATKSFMSLPAKVRREFNDDARAFVAFASDPNNLDQMREWKLAPAKEPARVVPADPTTGLVNSTGDEPAK